ncbi:tetracycline resistance ribosomal protection protein [Sedimentibacter hydroxybenzoicus DSM 7310]|uniref:Tetracycline resistance ribosomal protection protein n=1 Tax=Sedimentibacter hydroxybenzoicus DSM 7310 TaxID=1123245 RepID=A0A974BKJ2_SEDHY|nr:tetracycline resistance ribosomal protection protein [Sedimentibacter hydroxybenzoicus]NYB74999.1 tetracycline resistance ribosomal protection protein [Sedimentibacter hydroxybenzoicus DSM 7310]
MKIINIGILAHVDAGKTTVTECLLYKSGAINKIGRVDNGTTITDSMELERDRGITIRASTVSFNYNDTKVNIIDTPGHMDFIAEVERTLRVLDGAVLVISAKEGIQVQTKIIFNTLVKLNIPTIIFVNKIDRKGVCLDEIYNQMRGKLTPDLAIMQSVRIEDKDDFELINIKDDKVIQDQISEKLLDINDNLLEKYINGYVITEKEYHNAFLDGINNCNLYPVFHGSALKNIGIDELLFAITNYLPINNDNTADNLSAYVYKIDRDEESRKITFLRVFSGNIRTRQDVLINGTEEIFKIKSLESIMNGEIVKVDQVNSGDIAIISNANSLKIGDFIGKKNDEILDIKISEPALRASIKPYDLSKRSKLIGALFELTEEDPFLDCEINGDTEEIILKLFGNIQMEVIESLLKNRYKIDAKFGELKTIYKERPKRNSEAVIHIEVPPNPYWASIGLSIEPLPIGSGLLYETKVSYGYLNNSFQHAVKDAVEKACKEGLYGWEITDLKVTFIYGLYYSPVSTPSDFRNLTPYVFWEALRKSGTEILEPYLKYTVQVPNDFCGRAMSDLGKMRASIADIIAKGEETTLTGKIPVNTSKSYQAEILSYSNGKGIFITEPCGYDIYSGEPIINDIRSNDSNKEGLRYLFQKQDEN